VSSRIPRIPRILRVGLGIPGTDLGIPNLLNRDTAAPKGELSVRITCKGCLYEVPEKLSIQLSRYVLQHFLAIMFHKR
jgi:hypothetical protein